MKRMVLMRNFHQNKHQHIGNLHVFSYTFLLTSSLPSNFSILYISHPRAHFAYDVNAGKEWKASKCVVHLVYACDSD